VRGAVPLAKRGEPKGAGRTDEARFPLRSGGNLKEGGKNQTPSVRFPCKQGEPNGCAARFPLRSGGNLKEGGKNQTPSVRFPCKQGEPNGCAAWFPSRSGGNLKEGGILDARLV